jgi:hypothetical protein
MKNHLQICFFAAVLSLLAASCAVLQADSDYYREADFSTLHRYAWMADSPLVQSQSARVDISPLTIRRIREAIERDLAAKGFELVAAREDADFGLSFTVGARDMITLDDYPAFYRGAWAWGGTYYWPNVDIAMYTEGMLAIDVFDNATREPVWHGWARKAIVGADIKDPDATINAAVTAILADFPPP